MTPLLAHSPLVAQLSAAPPESAESAVRWLVHWLRLLVETTGATVIGLGAIAAIYAFIIALTVRRAREFTAVRLTLGRFLTLALEFQLAADILSTAVAPSWDQIGKLGAIAVIRTTLNFFLTRELREASSVGEPTVPTRGTRDE